MKNIINVLFFILTFLCTASDRPYTPIQGTIKDDSGAIRLYTKLIDKNLYIKYTPTAPFNPNNTFHSRSALKLDFFPNDILAVSIEYLKDKAIMINVIPIEKRLHLFLGTSPDFNEARVQHQDNFIQAQIPVNDA